MSKSFIKDIKKRIIENKKIVIILIIGFAGILFLSLSETDKTNTVKKEEETETTFTQSEEYASSLENRLADMIASIENAGQVKVMVTLKSSDEIKYAVNESIKNDDKSNNYSSNYVIIENKGSKEGIKIKIIEPEIRGVAVVCTGGDDPVVISRITSAVTTVLGIGANKVSVSKMK